MNKEPILLQKINKYKEEQRRMNLYNKLNQFNLKLIGLAKFERKYFENKVVSLQIVGDKLEYQLGIVNYDKNAATLIEDGSNYEIFKIKGINGIITKEEMNLIDIENKYVYNIKEVDLQDYDLEKLVEIDTKINENIIEKSEKTK